MNTLTPTNVNGSAAASAPRAKFEGIVHWDAQAQILTIAANRTLDSALARVRQESPEWVVIVRTALDRPDVYYYAFRPEELEALAGQYPERHSWPLEHALDLHEYMSSRTSRAGRPLGDAQGDYGLAAARIVDFDAADRVVTIGERPDMLPRDGARGQGRRGADELLDLGPTRGARASDTAALPPAEEIDVTLSAETGAEVKVGAKDTVLFRIELSAQATPLESEIDTKVKSEVPISVSLSAENDAVEIIGDHSVTVDPPASNRARSGFFQFKAVRLGAVRLAVSFRQGGTEIGVISLAVEVVPDEAQPKKAKGRADALPHDAADDDKLALIVEQRSEGGEVFYQYILHSESLDLPYRKLRSKPLLDRGGGPAATTLAFVQRIYARVTKELKSLEDLKQLQRETRALGISLCGELFDPEVARVLWPLRDRIQTIQIVSWEPYIPWELVRLTDPDSGDIDGRFLAEYGMIRTLSDDMPPRSLPMERWGYLRAAFPNGTFPSIGAELEYFTSAAPDGLNAHGITPAAIDATRDALYDAIASDDFDVLHLSCHAESRHESVEEACLIIGDEKIAGENQARLVEVDTITVQAEARLKGRRPLIFLNACETGRSGAVLTAWGGWPNVFLRAGAGAFVGSAWAVRDKPAAMFATAFYNALLGGVTLAEAASAARSSAKKLGDASWLAYKVYGHPRARRTVSQEAEYP